MKEEQKQHLIDMMKSDEELGLYDTKQTAVEWLVEELYDRDMIDMTIYQKQDKSFEKIIDQAKEMEKQQQGYSEEDMLKSFMAGIKCESNKGENFEQFIKQFKKEKGL
jgi:hypothetical protein